jgi:hypothetical protein
MVKSGTLDNTGYSLYTAAYNVSDHTADWFKTYDITASIGGQQYVRDFLSWKDISNICPGYSRIF